MSEIVPITMPKWGLSMTEGEVREWWKSPGDAFNEGEDLVDIETSKMNNAYEAPFSGRLARIVAQPGEKIPVGGLLGVAASEATSDAEIDAFVEQFQASFTPESDAEAAAEALDIRTVEIGGKRYRLGVAGDLDARVPTVLIHGYSGDLNTWGFNIPALAARAPAVALELPGHGASDKSLDQGSIAELAGVLTAVLASLGVKRCDLVGHSLGGAVAIQIALDAPALARSLVLLAPAGLPGSSVSTAFTDGVATAQSARQLKPVLAHLFTDPDAVTREMIDDMLKFKRLDGADEALAKIAAQLSRDPGFGGRLADLPNTTLILGAQDAVVSAPDKSALPADWRVHVLPSGHMPQIERAAETNALILEALNAGA